MNWKLGIDAGGAPMIDSWGVAEDLTLGYSLLRAMAAAGEPLVEIGPGVWRHSAEGVTWEGLSHYEIKFPGCGWFETHLE